MAKKMTDKVNNFLFTPEEPKDLEQSNNDISQAHLLKIIDETYSIENIEVKTDLTEAQIKAITKGQLFAERYNCEIMNKLCNKIMVLSVSKNRLGRKEFAEISKSFQSPMMEERAPLTIKERLMGTSE